MEQELQHVLQELLQAYDATIEGWMRALGLFDKGTEGHAYRVVGLSLGLGREFGLESSEMQNLQRGALLHDIGKMGVPTHLLLKPGALTEAEWKIMRRHPEYGYEILGPILYLKPAAEVAYCHHENWDGSGYPRGLKGESIPLMARIVSVCNVFDALMADMPYRPAWNREAVRNYIQAGSGKQFDPEIVRSFMRLIEHPGPQLS